MHYLILCSKNFFFCCLLFLNKFGILSVNITPQSSEKRKEKKRNYHICPSLHKLQTECEGSSRKCHFKPFWLKMYHIKPLWLTRCREIHHIENSGVSAFLKSLTYHIHHCHFQSNLRAALSKHMGMWRCISLELSTMNCFLLLKLRAENWIQRAWRWLTVPI